MRKSRFNEEEIIAILKDSEAGVEMGELCRRHGITRASFYRRKAQYGGRIIFPLPSLPRIEALKQLEKMRSAERVNFATVLK